MWPSRKDDDGTMATRVSNTVIFRILLLCCILRLCLSRPTSDSTATQTVDYLTRYGYLTRSSQETGNLRTEEEFKRAIRTMQKFAGIPDTGIVDDATVKLMRRKRCGMPDMIGNAERVRRYALQGQKWNRNKLTWTVSKQTYRFVNPEMVRKQVYRALNLWSDAANLTFSEVNRPDADIVVVFRQGYHDDGYPFDGKGSVLAHAFFPGEGIGGDAHFDADENWTHGHSERNPDGVNLFSVAAHEFGHSLGLSHSSVQGSLMFPYYQQMSDNYKLPYDDTVGIQQLYGPKNPVKWAPMPTVNPKVRANAAPRGRPDQPQRGGYTEPPPPSSGSQPDTCNTSIDAISAIRREIFLFKGQYFWRRDEYEMKDGYPVTVDRFWYNLTSDVDRVDRVDAVYERPSDNRIVFFSGKRYWLFNANHKESSYYPRPLTSLGLPSDLEKIDAAMVWGHNGKTYFFSGRQYWRFDENEGTVEADYPRDMAMWKGVPYDVDAAFQHTDGKTYFFKGDYFWKFNDKTMQVHEGYPRLIREVWFGCPSSNKIPRAPSEGHPQISSAQDRAIAFRTLTWLCVAIVVSLRDDTSRLL